VLSNEIYVKRVKEIIVDSVNCDMYDNEPLIWWDNLKYQIKRYSKLFSSNLAKEKRKDFFYIFLLNSSLTELVSCLYFSRFRKYFVFLSPSVAQMALDLNIAPLLCSNR
jgi:hypothetical protein